MNSLYRLFNFNWKIYIYPLAFSIALYSCTPDDEIPIIDEETCDDGVQNQGELGVDCGGPCQSCPSKMKATVAGVTWQSSGSINAIINQPGQSLLIAGSSGSSDISIIHSGAFVPGTYAISSAIYSELTPQKTYLSSEGSITFTKWNNSNQLVEGSFSFKAFDANGTGDSVVVAAGTFVYVIYQ
jgi:Family of unknown function (DUF6252)